jgi:hypothetical protein
LNKIAGLRTQLVSEAPWQPCLKSWLMSEFPPHRTMSEKPARRRQQQTISTPQACCLKMARCPGGPTRGEARKSRSGCTHTATLAPCSSHRPGHYDALSAEHRQYRECEGFCRQLRSSDAIFRPTTHIPRARLPWFHLDEAQACRQLGGWDLDASAAAPLIFDRFRRCTRRRDDGDSPTRT